MRGVSRFACLSRPLVLHYWLIQRNTNRAVVAAHLAGVDVGAGDAWGDCRRGQPVVDPPAYVASPGVGPVCPPGVGIGLAGVSGAEGIYKASV